MSAQLGATVTQAGSPCQGTPLQGFGEARRAGVEVATGSVSSQAGAEHSPLLRGRSASLGTRGHLSSHHVSASQPCSSACPGSLYRCFSLFRVSAFAESRIPHAVVAQSTEHIPETAPGSLSIPPLSQEHGRKLFLLGAGNKGQSCGAVNVPAELIAGVSSACSPALLTDR